MSPRAVQYDEFGGPEVLRVVEVPEVHPGPGEVRLAVRAVGLNPFDFKARHGWVPGIPPTFPKGTGGDVAGVIDEVGAGVQFSVGDEVFGWGDETLREQLVVAASSVALKPAAMPWEVAGSFSAPVQTAHFALETLGIGPDDTVLLSAAAGSVGIIYAQLAIARGARVIGTASQSNWGLLESVGVVPTSYGPGLVERVRALAPGGVTAVQDNFGRETIDAGLELGVPASRICSIVDHAAVAELGLASPGRYAKSAELLARYAAQAGLIVPVQATYPLDGAAEAFAVLEGRHVSGKLVVTP